MAKSLKEIRTLDDLNEYPQSMGPRIAIAREHMGMSVEEFATRLGVTRDSVTAWESDERTPRANRLLTMAGILGVSITWLLEGREDIRLGAGDVPSLDDVRARAELARGLITRGLDILESIEESLQSLADEEEVDPHEVEDSTGHRVPVRSRFCACPGS